MTDSNYIAMLLIMDRSGSMTDIHLEAENAINAFVDSQKNLAGRATLTFVRFDGHYEQVFSNTPIGDVPKLTLEPRGMTALDDAIGRGVTEFGQSLAAMPEKERPGKVLIVTMTDGYENSSKEWTRAKVRALITQQQDQWNWEFIFLGANMDAKAEAASMGMRANTSRGWAPTAAGVRAGGQSMVAYASSYRSTGKGDWGDDQQDD